MKELFQIHFEDEDGQRVAPVEGYQLVYADDPRDAMIVAGAMLAIHADAVAVIRKLS